MATQAVILLSGGLDSSTCLGLAKNEGYVCHTLAFDYGQRHRVELQAAQAISKNLGALSHKVISLDLRAIGGSALTDDIPVPDYTGSSDIPITYIPARNTIFLSLALGFAEVLKANTLFLGVSAVDYSHYPDCRLEYIKAFQAMANLSTKRGIEGHPVTISTPLIHLSKAQTISLGHKLGVNYQLTISCYQADDKGLACGRCDACALRIKGFKEAGVFDPTRYKKR